MDKAQKEAMKPETRQIRRPVFWWSGVTLLYLWGDLKIKTGGQVLAPFGISFEYIDDKKFLWGLLVINAVFWLRLLWDQTYPVLERKISGKMHHISNEGDDGEDYLPESAEDFPERKPYWHKKWDSCRRLKKLLQAFNDWVFPIGIPFAMGLVAIIWLNIRIWG